MGLAAYVSSRMSVHEGGREQAVEGGEKVRGGWATRRERSKLFLNSVFVC